MRHRRSFTSTLSALLVTGTIVHAVCLNGHPAVAEEYKAAKAVVAARVVSQHDAPETNDGFWYEGTMYTVKIERAFRGSVSRQAEVFSENSSSRFPMVVGSVYLLFIDERHDRLVVNYCGNSGVLSKRRKELRQVERLDAK
jgi:hypothetical protein